jgi:hypothetical protein
VTRKNNNKKLQVNAAQDRRKTLKSQFKTFKSINIDLIFDVFNATFSNISAISWRPVLVVEEAGVPGENHRPWASNC